MSEPSFSNSTSGFSVDMFHIYSRESPYYDPSLSPTQIIAHAIQRSINRSQWLNQSHPTATGSGSTETDIIRSIHSGSYFMRYKIGNKEVPSLGLLDTGSGLIWTQCFPCEKCFAQSLPHYEPRLSSTYKKVLCKDAECKSLSKHICYLHQPTCFYAEYYADQSHTMGWISKDSFTLASEGGTSNRIPSIVFGCSLSANVHGFAGYESGVIGLGRGPLSLVSQLGYFAKGKFSYCMVPITETRKRTTRLLFGDYSKVMPGANEPVVHIPLFVNKKDPSHYYVLIGFSVGTQKFLQCPNEANFIVDSGAVLTRLPDYMFIHLKSYVTSAMGHFTRKPDPKGVLDLCFATTFNHPWVPQLTLHFGNAHDVTFRDNNMFGKMDASTLCLLVVSAGEGKASLGFMAQANFMIGFDTEKEQMSFRRTVMQSEP